MNNGKIARYHRVMEMLQEPDSMNFEDRRIFLISVLSELFGYAQGLEQGIEMNAELKFNSLEE